MHRFVCVTLVVFSSASVLPAADALKEHPHPSRSQSRLWKASVAALVAGSTADAWSSLHRLEANPILRNQHGRFSGRSMGIKAAITGGSIAAQWLVLRKNPNAASRAAMSNFVMTGVFAGVTAYNLRNGPSTALRR